MLYSLSDDSPWYTKIESYADVVHLYLLSTNYGVLIIWIRCCGAFILFGHCFDQWPSFPQRKHLSELNVRILLNSSLFDKLVQFPLIWPPFFRWFICSSSFFSFARTVSCYVQPNLWHIVCSISPLMLFSPCLTVFFNFCSWQYSCSTFSVYP